MLYFLVQAQIIMQCCSFVPIKTNFDLQPSGIAENLSEAGGSAVSLLT